MGNKFSNNPVQNPECATQVDFEHEIIENNIAKPKNPTELDNENKAENNSVEDETTTCLKEFHEIYDNICKQSVQIDASYEMDNLDPGEQNVVSFDSLQKNKDGMEEHNNDLFSIERRNVLEGYANNLHDNSNVEVCKSIYEDFSVKKSNLTDSADLKNISVNSTKNVLVQLSEVNGDQAPCPRNSSTIISEALSVNKKYLDAEITKNIPSYLFNSRKMSEIDIQHKDYALNFIENHKEITLRNFRRNKHNFSITQEASNGRNDTNLITSFHKTESSKVDEISNKVENNEIIVISDDEDALQTVKRDVSKNMKPIEEVLELSDDKDPLQILDTEEYLKEELVPDNSECLKPFNANEILTKIEDLQSYSEYSNTNEKPKTNKSPKKDVEYNNTECLNELMIKHTTNKNGFPKEGLVFNYSESVKPIDIMELPTQELQFKNDVYAPAIDTDESSKCFDPEFKSNEYLNVLTNIETNAFTAQSLDDDCDWYHSSDFEFIDEDEAKNWPNFVLTLDEDIKTNVENSSHNFKKPEKVTNKKVGARKRAAIKKAAANKKVTLISQHKNETFSEKAVVEQPTTIYKANVERILEGNENLNAADITQFSEENEMFYNYLQTLQPPINKQFNKDYRDTHRIPNNEEYLHLFSGIYTPYPAYGANKKINSATGMPVAYQGAGFDVNFVDDSTPEERREAEDTEMYISTKYSIENRPRRFRRTY